MMAITLATVVHDTIAQCRLAREAGRQLMGYGDSFRIVANDMRGASR